MPCRDRCADVVAREALSFHRVNRADRKLAPLLSKSFSPSELAESRVLTHLNSVVYAQLSRHGYAAGPLVSAQVNFDTYGERQLTHADGDVVTALFFANPEWNPDWLGETFFYDSTEVEVLAAVTPRPGRLVLFDGRIPHRGGVPLRSCFLPRVVVVFKWALSASESGR